MSARFKGQLFGAVLVWVVATLLVIVYLGFFDLREPPLRVTYTHTVPLAGPANNRDEIVEMPVVWPGQVFWTYREFCVTTPYHAIRVDRLLLPRHPSGPDDYVGFPLMTSRVYTTRVGCRSRSFPNELPVGTTPRVYDFVGRVQYRMEWNRLALFTMEWPSITIVVGP